MLPKLGDILTTLGARGAAMAGPLIVSVITARALGPEDRGQYFLVISYAQIAAQIANLGLQTSNTFIAAKQHALAGRLLVNSLYVALLVAPVVAFVIALSLGWPEAIGMASARGAPGPVALAAVFIAPLIVAFLYVSNLAIAVGRVFLFNLLTAGASAVSVVLAVIAWVSGGSTFSFLFAAAASALLACIFGAGFLVSGARPSIRFDAALFRSGIIYAFKAYLTTMFGFLMMRVGILALQQNAGLAEVGFFSIAVQLTDGLAQLPSTIGVLLFPALLRTEPKHRRKAMWQAMLILGATMFMLLLVSGIACRWLIPLLFGDAYAPSYPLTLAMLPQLLLISFLSVISQYLAAEGYPWAQVFAWVLGFVVQAGLSYWLTSSWGGFGVAVALTVSYGLVLTLLLVQVYARRKRQISNLG